MERYKDTRRISVIAIIANLFLFTIKITVGISSKSQALLADAINSGTDIFNSVMMYVGNMLASKPRDKEHPYGHGKIEYVFSLIISICMLLLSFEILQSAITALITKEYLIFSKYLVIVCVLTIIIKGLLYIFIRRIGKKHDNLLIKAAEEDQRNDIFVTSSTLIGIILTKFGLYYVDSIVAIFISIWIAYVALKLFLTSYYVLIDTSIEENLKNEIKERINETKNCTIDSLISKPIGNNYILLIEVSMDEDMSLDESHDVAEKIKEQVCSIEKIVDAIVHVNPK